MKCTHALITEENAMEPYLYGNVYRASEESN
jgi:hypothetical protein